MEESDKTKEFVNLVGLLLFAQDNGRDSDVLL